MRSNNRRKRVLFVFHDNDTHSGATASMLDIIEFLSEQNSLELFAVVPHRKGDLQGYLEQLGVNVMVRTYFSCRYTASTGGAEKASAITKSLVKCCATFVSALSFKFYRRDFDWVYSNTTDNYWGMFYSYFSKVKHICHVREFGLLDQNQSQILGDNNFYKLLSHSAYRIIAISDVLNNYLCREKSIESDKVVRIYDDVGSTTLPLSSRPVTKPLRMLIVGGFLPGKGHQFILDAIKRLKESGITVLAGFLGDDSTPYASHLKSLTKQYELEDSVTFHGFVTDVKSIREQYEFAVVASTSEAFGRVTIEAMMSSQVVIASDTGANPELVNHGVTGILYEYDNIDSFFHRVCEINDGKYDLHDIARNAHQFSEGFYRNNCAKRILEILND